MFCLFCLDVINSSSDWYNETIHLFLGEDRCTAKSDHYSASSEDSDSSKNSIMPPPKLHVRKHKALQSTTEGHTRSSSEDSILDGQPKLTTQTADLIPPADHPNFGVIVFAGNFSGTEEYPIVAVVSTVLSVFKNLPLWMYGDRERLFAQGLLRLRSVDLNPSSPSPPSLTHSSLN